MIIFTPLVAVCLMCLLLLTISCQAADTTEPSSQNEAMTSDTPIEVTANQQMSVDAEVGSRFCSETDGDLVSSRIGDEKFLTFRLGCIEDRSTWTQGSFRRISRSDSVAFGDIDKDGDLDLAVGYSCLASPCRKIIQDNPNWGIYAGIYKYEDDAYVLAEIFTATLPISRTSVAFGDMDDDGDLDLAVGLWSEILGTHILQNDSIDGDIVFSSPDIWQSKIITTVGIVLGDVAGDNNLDIGLANFGGASQIYIGTGGIGESNPFEQNSHWKVSESAVVYFHDKNLPRAGADYGTIDFGDPNGDGELDIALSFAPTVRDKIALENEGLLGEITPNIDRHYRLTVFENKGDIIASRPIIFEDNPASRITAGWAELQPDGLDVLVSGGARIGKRVFTFKDDPQLVKDAHGLFSNDYTQHTTAIAFGDIDNNGFKDLVAANTDTTLDMIYLNDHGTLQGEGIPFSRVIGYSTDVALGDIEGDGDLDIVISGNSGTKVYFNQSGSIGFDAPIALNKPQLDTSAGGTTSMPPAQTQDLTGGMSIAWGDVDGDGDLDVAVGRQTADSKPLSNTLHINNNGVFDQVIDLDSTYIARSTRHIAWGDINGDGILELAAGDFYGCDSTTGAEIGTAISLYSFNITDTAPFIQIKDRIPYAERQKCDHNIQSLSWGDVIDDEGLDLVIGRNSLFPTVLVNKDGGFKTEQRKICLSHVNDQNSSCTPLSLFSMALGDVNRDGEQDIAIGNRHVESGNMSGHNIVFRIPQDAASQNGPINISTYWRSEEVDDTYGIAWGDYNGDGFPDLAVGNLAQPNRIYMNIDGTLETQASWSSQDNDKTFAVAWVDIDGDGDMDLTAANSEAGRDKVYINHNGIIDPVGTSISPVRNYSAGFDWGDYDNDGDMDLAVADAITNSTVVRNLRNDNSSNLNIDINLDRVKANHYSVSKVFKSGNIAIPFTLTSPDGHVEISQINPYYSLDGGDNWKPAKGELTMQGSEHTPEDSLSTAQGSNAYIFHWDIFESRIMGQSDNVVFRIEAIPSVKPQENEKAGPYQYPLVSAQTYPFRVRGTTIRIDSSNDASTINVADVWLHQRTRQDDGTWKTSAVRSPSDKGGRLSGRGEIAAGDQLLVLVPQPLEELDRQGQNFALTEYISEDKLTVYYTNQTITDSKEPIIGHVVSENLDEQQITISDENLLILFHLDVSLEWDASEDELYIPSLRANLLKASEELYDWTNGQMALGNVKVYQNKENWEGADVQILASNRVRPVAHWGGIVNKEVHIARTNAITATPGAIRIGPNWNRYGNAQTIGNDWPRVLAHELAHYMLFLEDMYIGIEEQQGLLVPIATCKRTAMADPYVDINTEFLTQTEFDNYRCSDTLAQVAEWTILNQVYGLNIPAERIDGPDEMPFVFTAVTVMPSEDNDILLEDDRVLLSNLDEVEIITDTADITDEDIATQLSAGRAYLIQERKERILDLGRPVLDSIQARGAEDGDELCIFAEKLFGCAELNEDRLPSLTVHDSWTPTVRLETEGPRLTIRVTDAQLSGPVTATVSTGSVYVQTLLTSSDDDQSTVIGTITFTEPQNSAQILLEGNEFEQRTMTGYTISGGPANTYCHGGVIASVEGNVVASAPNLDDDQVVLLETPIKVPELLRGIEQIGNAYRASLNRTTERFGNSEMPKCANHNPNEPFSCAGISFQYLETDLLLSGFPKESLTVYYHPGSSSDPSDWKLLTSVRDITQNFVSAPLIDEGIYLLAAGPAQIDVDLGGDSVLEMKGKGLTIPFTTTVNAGENGQFEISVDSGQEAPAEPKPTDPKFKLKLDIENKEWLLE